MKILVTGAAGFIGSNLVEHLLEDGVRPKNIRLLVLEEDVLEKIPEEVEVVRADIRSKRNVVRAVNGISIVYHLAAKTALEGKAYEDFKDTNVAGTRNLVEAAVKEGVRKFVFFSSIAVYGLPAYVGPMINWDETRAKSPSEPYGLSKLRAEEVVTEAYKKHGLNYVIVRPTTVYGPRDHQNIIELYGAVKRSYFFMVGSGKNLMDYVYVKDLVAAARVAQKNRRKAADYIIGGGRPLPLGKIVKIMYRQAGKDAPAIRIPRRFALLLSYVIQFVWSIFGARPPLFPNRVRVLTTSCYFSVEKAKRELGYSPKTSFQNGIAETFSRTAKSIIYVNYSPYENAGKILDHLLDKYENVFLFSISFHNIKNKKTSNQLVIYTNKRVIRRVYLYYMYIPERLVYFLVPVRSAINFFQIFSRSLLLKYEYGEVATYFSVNAYTAFIGIILKTFGIVEKNIFWVWDYYPIAHPNLIIRWMRRTYWQFEKLSLSSDKIVFLSKRIKSQWLKKDMLKTGSGYPVVPIGTDLIEVTDERDLKKVKLVFFGVLKKSQGLDMIFDAADLLVEKYPMMQLEVVGTGPDEKYFRAKARKSPLTVNFHGYVGESRLREMFRYCAIGLATYLPDRSNVSYYGDPSKVKMYLSHELPVITTDVFEFSKEIDKHAAGVIVNYFDSAELPVAVETIIANYQSYRKNAKLLKSKYYYKRVYEGVFD